MNEKLVFNSVSNWLKLNNKKPSLAPAVWNGSPYAANCDSQQCSYIGVKGGLALSPPKRLNEWSCWTSVHEVVGHPCIKGAGRTVKYLCQCVSQSVSQSVSLDFPCFIRQIDDSSFTPCKHVVFALLKIRWISDHPMAEVSQHVGKQTFSDMCQKPLENTTFCPGKT